MQKVGAVLLVIVALALVQFSAAKRGVDVSAPVSEADFRCLKSKGYDFVVVRAYESSGRPDPNVVATVENAWKAGMSHVDVYMFPCPRCSTGAAEQVKQAIEYLASHRVKYGTFWLDVEGGPLYWRTEAYNVKFIGEMIAAVKEHGQHVAVYTSASQWGPIAGIWDGPAREGLKLWYANYDGQENFNDFRKFGGWDKPEWKQYRGSVNECGAGVDLNWGP